MFIVPPVPPQVERGRAEVALHRAFYRKSARPQSHPQPLSVWLLADAAGARAWLAAHPTA